MAGRHLAQGGGRDRSGGIVHQETDVRSLPHPASKFIAWSYKLTGYAPATFIAHEPLTQAEALARLRSRFGAGRVEHVAPTGAPR